MSLLQGGKSWWDKRSNLEKGLLVLISVLLLLVIILSTVIGCWSNRAKICLDSSCATASALILRNMNKTVDPCTDFYKFSCGKFAEDNPVPEQQLQVTQFSKVNADIVQQLQEALSEPVTDADGPLALAKKYFQACMDEQTVEKLGKQPFLQVLDDLGGWPLLNDSWSEEDFDWVALTGTMRKSGLDTGLFLQADVSYDIANTTVNIIQLDQATFGLHRQLLVDGQGTDVYLELLVNLAEYLGANRTQAEEELGQALELEISLANVSWGDEARRNYSKFLNYMTIEDIQKNYPKTPWLRLINNIVLDFNITNDERVLFMIPSFFAAFDELLAVTPKRVVANYAAYRVILELIAFAPKDMYQLYVEALTKLSGRVQRPKKLEECTQFARQRLPHLVNALYVRKFFDEDGKKIASEMVGYVKASFKEILEDVKWMDKETKRRAVRKAEKMKEKIAYPDQLLSNAALNSHFGSLEINPEEYLKSYLTIQRHAKSYSVNLLHKGTNQWTSFDDCSTPSAYYAQFENSIVLSAGILQGIFFRKDRPKYMNFGAIGSVIGHEITHGFDDKGRQLNADGNLASWWEKRTEEKFLSKTKCIIDQYSSYTVPEINQKINGINTQGENIADNGGLKAAYRAYKKWTKDHQKEPRLPGLQEYTPEQLFWISSALKWCHNTKATFLALSVQTDEHSPNEFRVVGPVSNNEDFARDFNCPATAPMNPSKKCVVW